MSILQIRLKNCIQTILDLEPKMHEKGEDCFDEEFSSLKKYLDRVDQMDLAEEEVLRLEAVTSSFLAELMGRPYWQKPCSRFLQ